MKLFHTVPVHAEFYDDGKLFMKINAREGMDVNGQRKSFLDSHEVSDVPEDQAGRKKALPKKKRKGA